MISTKTNLIMATNKDTSKEKWLVQSEDEYQWEDENEDRLWYCTHGKAYGIKCRPCEEEED